MDGCDGGEPALMMELSSVVAIRGERAEPREWECSRLLAALEETGMPLLSLRYGVGSGIYYSGDDAGRALYVLTGGAAKLFVSYPGYAGSKNATFVLLGPGEVFGYPLFAGGRPERVPAEAFMDCEIVKIPATFVERAMRRRPEVALEIAALLERRLVDYEEFVGCLLPRRTEVRLARALLVLARKFGKRTGDGGVGIELRLTRTDLADMTASTRESVTAAVIRLRQTGILEMEAGRIVLLDPKMLAEVAHQ